MMVGLMIIVTLALVNVAYNAGFQKGQMVMARIKRLKAEEIYSQGVLDTVSAMRPMPEVLV